MANLATSTVFDLVTSIRAERVQNNLPPLIYGTNAGENVLAYRYPEDPGQEWIVYCAQILTGQWVRTCQIYANGEPAYKELHEIK